MNKKLIFSVILVLLLAFVAVLACGQTNRRVGVERWEYTVLSGKNYPTVAAMVSEMNSLGEEGWELIEVVMSSGGELVFKRRLP